MDQRPQVRPEQQRDRDAVFVVNAAAFPTGAEARLVDLLRAKTPWLLSLVAEQQGQVVGHILFSSVSLDGHPELRLMGLAPMAVLPARQRRGVESALVDAGLTQYQQLGVDAAAAVGHPS